jgi:zinc/manganese transport system substrate-binding protein
VPSPLPLLAVPALVLALGGCTALPATNAGDGVVRVVASTNVYGDIATTIGGSTVEVTSIIDDPAQDPHEFEANGRVQLALSRADVVIVNGGGYDDFATTMLTASGNTGARLIDAVDLSGYDRAADGFNEHVWYDYPTMKTVAKAIAAALDIADPAHTGMYDGRAAGVVAEFDGLIQLEGSISAVAQGDGVVITEPVPLYLLEACGFENLTPPEFSEAVENDTDVPPALLQKVLNLIGGGSVDLVVYNQQTGGAQTDAVLDVATDNRVPAIGVFETVPDGLDYFTWQNTFLQDLLRAVVA